MGDSTVNTGSGVSGTTGSNSTTQGYSTDTIPIGRMPSGTGGDAGAGGTPKGLGSDTTGSGTGRNN